MQSVKELRWENEMMRQNHENATNFVSTIVTKNLRLVQVIRRYWISSQSSTTTR